MSNFIEIPILNKLFLTLMTKSNQKLNQWPFKTKTHSLWGFGVINPYNYPHKYMDTKKKEKNLANIASQNQ